jgi:hypothetical protein
MARRETGVFRYSDIMCIIGGRCSGLKRGVDARIVRRVSGLPS